LDPAGSSRTGDGGESTAATSLPDARDRDFKCPGTALSAGDIRELLNPAAQAECTPSRDGWRLAHDIGHFRVKQESPQIA
jgi:hypothetical protein